MNQEFNWKDPDYRTIFAKRAGFLAQIRAQPEMLPALKVHYQNNPVDFIRDWGTTFDPRNVERGLPALIPFVPFPKQEEWCNWVVDHWKAQKPGLTEKSRDMGMSWLSVALACTLCLFNPGMVIGFGSRKEEYVDSRDDDKSLFHRARTFMSNIPQEFQAGWTIKDAPSMRLNFPGNGSHITGEAGDNIGRGGRASIYFLDEFAFIEHQALVERALSQTTNCRMYGSTPNGSANLFAEKRFSGKIDVQTIHWRSDPRKYYPNDDGSWNDDWYQKQCAELDPVTVAQEIDIDYNASIEGVLIESKWVQAAIDAHTKLGITPTGSRTAALDVADKGKDKCALAGAHGILLNYLEEWSGKGSDVQESVERAFLACDKQDLTGFNFDGDGIGGAVDGIARVINARRKSQGQKGLQVSLFKGSGAVLFPNKQDVKGQKNQDFFANRKAQAWWALRNRFENTWRAIDHKRRRDAGEVVPDFKVDVDELISIDPNLPSLSRLVQELSQPTYKASGAGKVLIDKAPEDAASPNLADAVMMRFAPVAAPIVINQAALTRFASPGMRVRQFAR